jgi:hypothetical protein
MKIKNKKTKKTLTTKHLPTKVKLVKNTPTYYLCMGTNCQGKNIAQVAKDCKSNAPSLTAKRVKKVKELAKAAKVIGKFALDLEKVLPR